MLKILVSQSGQNPGLYKWELWLQGVGFISQGVQSSELNAVQAAKVQWEYFISLTPIVEDSGKY